MPTKNSTAAVIGINHDSRVGLRIIAGCSPIRWRGRQSSTAARQVPRWRRRAAPPDLLEVIDSSCIGAATVGSVAKASAPGPDSRTRADSYGSHAREGLETRLDHADPSVAWA